MRPHHLLASFTVLASAAMAMPACSSPSAEAEPLGSVTSAAGGAIAEVTSFGSNPGALKMWEYVPAGLGTGKPLVLVLHGCGQGATDAAATGWNELADQAGFVVVYPEQQTVNNITKCFSWWGDFSSSDDIVRGKGENLSIKQMVDKSIAAHGSDPTRVFVVGFSAGGAEAMVMTSTYPDVFAAGAAIAGIPYDCTTSFSEVSTCIKPGKTKTATEWAALAKAGDPGFTGAWPRMSFWQGSADATVGPQNRTELVKQWTGVHGVDTTTPLADTVDGAAHSSYKNGAGKVVVETYEIPGMDHGVPVVPANSCGTASTYAIDKGICAARHIAAFFGIASASASDAGSDAKPDAKDGGPISSSSSTGGIAGGDAAAASSGGTADPGAADGSHSSTCAAAPPTGRSPFTSSALLGSFLTLTVALARSRSRSRSNKVVPR